MIPASWTRLTSSFCGTLERDLASCALAPLTDSMPTKRPMHPDLATSFTSASSSANLRLVWPPQRRPRPIIPSRIGIARRGFPRRLSSRKTVSLPVKLFSSARTPSVRR